jgi:hypothetical protein
MTNSPTPPPARKGRGCFFYGCLTCLVLLVIVCVMAFFAVRFVRNRINDYTQSAPMKLPRVEMPDAEFKQLEGRVKSFGEALDQGKPTEPLMLTERDVNALIVNAPNTKELADKVYVSLTGDQVKGQVSIPLTGLGWLGRGRYLNGDATFNVSLENGVLIVTAREIRVSGTPLPDSVMSQVRQENLAKEAYKDPKNAEAIRKLESIQVQDGQVIIKARAPK